MGRPERCQVVHRHQGFVSKQMIDENQGVDQRQVVDGFPEATADASQAKARPSKHRKSPSPRHPREPIGSNALISFRVV